MKFWSGHPCDFCQGKKEFAWMDSDDEASENSDDGDEASEPPPKEEVKQSRILVCKISTIWFLKLPPLVSHQYWRMLRDFCNYFWVHGQFLDMIEVSQVSSCVAWISPREESDTERKHDTSDEDPVLSCRWVQKTVTMYAVHRPIGSIYVYMLESPHPNRRA